MKLKTLVGAAVCLVLVVGMSVTTLPGWVVGTALAAALVLAVPLGVKRYRLEHKLARAIRRALSAR